MADITPATAARWGPSSRTALNVFAGLRASECPSLQCGVLRCFRRPPSANHLTDIIENFRLVGTLPHAQSFEPSPAASLGRNFHAHDWSLTRQRARDTRRMAKT